MDFHKKLCMSEHINWSIAKLSFVLLLSHFESTRNVDKKNNQSQWMYLRDLMRILEQGTPRAQKCSHSAKISRKPWRLWGPIFDGFRTRRIYRAYFQTFGGCRCLHLSSQNNTFLVILKNETNNIFGPLSEQLSVSVVFYFQPAWT